MENINDILAQLSADDNLRVLRSGECDGKYITYDGVRYLNMSSNDYLGLCGDTEFQKQFFEGFDPAGRFVMSNPASRLMTGNSTDYDELEASVAALYTGKSAFVLSSGYMVNSGVLPALTSKGDLVLADKLVHASLIDGLRLCECEWQRFNHNDMEHLENLLRKHRAGYRNVWVVAESIYSMDGDRAPVAKLVELGERYDLKLYLDEAHAFGVMGENGAGLASELGLADRFDVIVATFGKALASCGAFAAVTPDVRRLLVNKMRTVIFSTALPPLNLRWTKFLIDRLPGFADRRAHLRGLVEKLAPGNPDATHIMPVMAYENATATRMSEEFRQAGFWVTPIRYPTVAKGRARVRVSLSAAMSEEDMDRFMEVCRRIEQGC